MGRIRNTEFKREIYCTRCNKKTEFIVHQFSMVKTYKKTFKNSAVAKCSECGRTKAIVLYGNTKKVKSKGKEKLIIDANSAQLKSIENEISFFSKLKKIVGL